MKRRLFAGFGSATSQLVTLIFLLQLLLTIVLLGYVQWAADQQLHREQRTYVAELRDTLSEIYVQDGPARLATAIEARVGTGGWSNGAVLLTAADGTPIAGNLRAWPGIMPVGVSWQEIDLYRKDAPHPERIGLSTTRLAGGERLLTGWVLDDGLRLRRSVEGAMLAALFLAVPIALASAMLLGRVLSRRLGAISGTTVAVAGGDLTRRVPRDGSGDAFDELARQVNAMLDRVETLVSELRLVTDSLAHDLRSPLTRVQSRLEQASAAVGDGGAGGTALAAIGDAQAELGALLRILSTALQISRAEAGIGTEQLADVAIADLLGDIADLYGPVAEDSGFALAVEVPADLHASLHRELVGQALANLVENALRHAVGGRRIVLSGARAGEGVALAVADDGPGIPADLRDEARRRFVRLDAARSEAGSGLGLALVDAVARLHGGHLDLADAGPGLRATLVLPARAR
ncbi:sensor histidine kinase [Novosphingobium bradum]|uniref:histidine kinase n=1 Tax=Novosphingobium bradum TaxID=1737444 RepID=A0ABV7IU52_9SPHN